MPSHLHYKTLSCWSTKINSILHSTLILLSFAAYLAKHNITRSTIKVYISAIHNLHVASWQHQHFANQLIPRLEQVLHGIKREQAYSLPVKVHLPSTTQVMQDIKQLLLKRPHDYNNILIWAVCCTGFLRCSEFTVPQEHEYNPTVHFILQGCGG